jgi:hypothetical protein
MGTGGRISLLIRLGKSFGAPRHTFPGNAYPQECGEGVELKKCKAEKDMPTLKLVRPPLPDF